MSKGSLQEKYAYISKYIDKYMILFTLSVEALKINYQLICLFINRCGTKTCMHYFESLSWLCRHSIHRYKNKCADVALVAANKLYCSWNIK